MLGPQEWANMIVAGLHLEKEDQGKDLLGGYPLKQSYIG